MNLIWVAGGVPSVRLPGSMASPMVNLTGVDWSREAVVIVDMGEQRTGGYAVTVRAVHIVAPNRIELDLEVTRPGPGMMVTQVFTHPYAVARLPRAGLAAGSVTLIAYDQGGTEVARRVVSP